MTAATWLMRSARPVRTPARQERGSPETPAAALLRVQRAAGNHAVTHMLGEARLQAKLAVNAPGDVYEVEADRVADSVMRMPDPGSAPALSESPVAIQRCACGGTCASCRQGGSEEELHRSDTGPGGAGVAPPVVHEVLSRAGEPLDAGTRDFMEPRFGVDLGGVRVHRDGLAGDSARAVSALAYTVGTHVVFGAGRYAPATGEGRRLLAHELAHVVQQSRSRASVGAPGPRLARQQAPGTPAGSTAKSPEKKKSDVHAGRWDWPWPIFDHLVLKLPERWKSAYHAMRSRDDHIFFTKEKGYDLVHRQVMALMNLFQAGVFTGISPYKPDFSKALDMAEGLSGVTDTWINLASLGLRLDLKKYLEDDVGDAALGNLAWAILYGVALQGALVGLNVATESDLDFTSLLGKALKKPTAAPRGLSRPYNIGNIPDERWGSYPFWAGPGGLSLKLGGVYDPAKPYTFSANFGFNIAQVADLYPEDDAAKAKYNGFELFPYFSLSHSWAKTREPPFDPNEPLGPSAGSLPPKVADQWLAGFFLGDRGVYTLIEGGPKLAPGSDLLEVYTRTGLFLRDLGPISLLQGTGEWSYRPHDSALRARLNAATQITLLDNRRWQLTLGGQLGYLFPSAGSPGAVDLGGGLSFYHKSWRSGFTDPLKSGFEASAMWRPQDPFDPASSRLTSLKAGISIFDFFKFAVEYHTITGGKLSDTLPREDLRFMIYPGKGIFSF